MRGEVDSFDVYAEQVYSEQLGLSVEEEMDCILNYQLTGNIEDRDKVIKNNLTFVLEMCKNKCKNWEDTLELVSIGYMALIHSIDTFKIDKGCSFKAHAASTIRWKLRCKGLPMDEGLPLEWYNMLGYSYGTYENVEAAMILEDAFSALKEREKAVIYLKYWKELSAIEIANILRISPGYVYICENKALHKMRERITYAGGI